MEQAVKKIQTAQYGKPQDPNEPFFGGSWQGWCAGRGSEVTALSLPRW